MGSRPYGLDLDRPVALDGFRLGTCAGLQDRTRHRARARRSPICWCAAASGSAWSASRARLRRAASSSVSLTRSRSTNVCQAESAPLPPPIPLAARSKVVLIGDFLSEESAVRVAHRRVVGAGRARPGADDRRSDRGDFSVRGPCRIYRRGRRDAPARAARTKPARSLSRQACAPSRCGARGLRFARLGLRPASHRQAGGAGAARPAHAP